MQNCGIWWTGSHGTFGRSFFLEGWGTLAESVPCGLSHMKLLAHTNPKISRWKHGYSWLLKTLNLAVYKEPSSWGPKSGIHISMSHVVTYVPWVLLTFSSFLHLIFSNNRILIRDKMYMKKLWIDDLVPFWQSLLSFGNCNSSNLDQCSNVFRWILSNSSHSSFTLPFHTVFMV